ncbi:MAG: glycosyltransferase [Victivallales bacterium]|nr:glycosyltransferase [Victivallales bacterium]MBR6074947.1 glycosyltransferase [Victivallales bacterium]
MSQPLVSITCLAYNHEKYIRDCMEGFLFQKTDFPFEVLVHDDASTDSTPAILKEYAAKYPDIVKPILRETNLHSVPGHRSLNLINLDRAQGKYVAMCEGDDFWCSPYKLQKQFDFMEAHPDYSISACGIYYLNHIHKTYTPQGFPAEEWPIPQAAACKRIFFNDHPLHTPAVFFRMDALRAIQDLFQRDILNAPMGDTQLFYHLATQGLVGYIRERMATYRQHGSSSSSYNDPEKARRFAQRSLDAHIRIADLNNHPEWGEEYSRIAEAKAQAIGKKPSFSDMLQKKLTIVKRFLRGDYANYRRYLSLTPAERVRMFEKD